VQLSNKFLGLDLAAYSEKIENHCSGSSNLATSHVKTCSILTKTLEFIKKQQVKRRHFDCLATWIGVAYCHSNAMHYRLVSVAFV